MKAVTTLMSPGENRGAGQREACTATVRSGRIRLPAAVIKALGVNDGGQIVFFLERGRNAALVAPLLESVRAPVWE
jgi:Antidote-toxin recognition MazE, bacterial antitoxin